jgi:drug/metabolite transporter superfamily protein YnfA
MSPFLVVTSVALFVLAGLCEIGGGYLVWLWLREGRSALLGVLGGVILFVYGVVPTLSRHRSAASTRHTAECSSSSRFYGAVSSRARRPIASM